MTNVNNANKTEVNLAEIKPSNLELRSSPNYIDASSIAIVESIRARIQSQFTMALANPRSYEQSRYRILEACKRPAFAEKVEYVLEYGKSVVRGPGIRFAEMALREWGNIDYQNIVVHDDENSRRVMVIVSDLETNTTFSASIHIEKTVERKYGKNREIISERVNSYGEKTFLVKATEQEVNMKQAALISKALRNEGLRLIPQEIIDEAIKISRRTMQSSIEKNIIEARNRLSDAFATLGIQPKHIEDYLGYPLAQCTVIDIQDLRAIYNAINSGESRWVDFTGEEESRTAALEIAKKTMQGLKEKMAETKEAKETKETEETKNTKGQKKATEKTK